jgi:hypothetical protein
MRTAILVILIVLALIVGGLLTLRRSAKTGMPSQDVLERATRRARELEAQEKREEHE